MSTSVSKMKLNALQEDLMNIDMIGIECCDSHQAAMSSLCEIVYNTGEEQNAINLKTQLPTGLLKANFLIPKALTLTKLMKDSPSRGAQFATMANEEHLEHGRDVELLTMPSLLDDSYNEVDNCRDKDSADPTSCSEFSCSSTPPLDGALALEVGLNAHEYIEGCFYTEGLVLDREKFNAIPEINKSDFAIKGRLGKGNFSDVFDVVCTSGTIFDTRMSNRISCRGSQLNLCNQRPRSTRRNSTSVTLTTTARPSTQIDRHLGFAMKCLRPQIRFQADQFTIGAEDLVHETAILSNLDHQYIIKLHGRASGHLADAFLSNDGYFILIDRLNETLPDKIAAWKRIKANGVPHGPTLKQLEAAYSITDAMAYLHSKNIVFRDLKPDNVGFDHQGTLKIFDFGFAIGLPEKDGDNPAGFLYDRCGTPRYMAPEVAFSLGYETKADVYSFGILLWEMCALNKPFSSITSSNEFTMAVFMGGRRPSIDDRWPVAVKELMCSCWSATPSTRPTMLDIKSSLSSVILKIPSHESSDDDYPI